MEPRLHFVTLATRDLDLARTFYADGFGWQPQLDVPGEIIFYPVGPGLLLGFFDAEKFAEDAGGAQPAEPGGHNRKRQSLQHAAQLGSRAGCDGLRSLVMPGTGTGLDTGSHHQQSLLPRGLHRGRFHETLPGDRGGQLNTP